MDFFFEPNGIAVVGATPELQSGGRHLFTNLALGYRGLAYPVNPRHREVLGSRCYSRVTEIERPLDLALIFVPAKAVPLVLDDCVAKGVRGAIIESGGFAEVGPEGKALQDQCASIARKGNLRLWGPNCMGLIDTSRRHVFSFVSTDPWPGLLNPGHVSFVVQSGLLSAGFVITLLSNATVGLAKVCSIGNKSDVEETELLEYLLMDPATKVICLYLESFSRGRRFIDLATSSTKPIVLLKGGKSPSGALAAASHTASLAGNHDLIHGVLKQAGIHQADDFFEMVDIARALEKDFFIPRSAAGKPRIAVLTYSGAAGIVTTDHLEKLGLALSPLSGSTLQRLQQLSPAWMPVKNPVDLWPAVEKHGPVATFKPAMKALHDDSQVDGLIVHLYSGPGLWSTDMGEIVSGVGRPRKPIVFWLLGPRESEQVTRRTLEKEGFPVFDEIHRTVRVMASLFETPHRRVQEVAYAMELKVPPPR